MASLADLIYSSSRNQPNLAQSFQSAKGRAIQQAGMEQQLAANQQARQRQSALQGLLSSGAGAEEVFRQDPATGLQMAEFQALRKGKSSIDAKDTVQSSKLLPGGLAQLVYKSGRIDVVPAAAADAILIREAEDRGASLQGLRAQEREGGKGSAQIGLKAFDQVGKIRGNIGKLKEVVSLVGEGAETGPLAARLPSFRAETIRLNNVQKQLGLDVIGSVTFGALSQGELDLALETALPTNLEGPQLVDWANRKISAQEKLASYMEEQAEFLLKSGNRVPDWIRHKREQGAPVNQPGSAQQVGGFTVEVMSE
ncbi:MAG: hypothetical protein ABFS03_00950 [Chloroflexota bacterium]